MIPNGVIGDKQVFKGGVIKAPFLMFAGKLSSMTAEPKWKHEQNLFFLQFIFFPKPRTNKRAGTWVTWCLHHFKSTVVMSRSSNGPLSRHSWTPVPFNPQLQTQKQSQVSPVLSSKLANRLHRALETWCGLELELISHWVNFETVQPETKTGRFRF